MVRTLHSYAYSVLRTQASGRGRADTQAAGRRRVGPDGARTAGRASDRGRRWLAGLPRPGARVADVRGRAAGDLAPRRRAGHLTATHGRARPAAQAPGVGGGRCLRAGVSAGQRSAAGDERIRGRARPGRAHRGGAGRPAPRRGCWRPSSDGSGGSSSTSTRTSIPAQARLVSVLAAGADELVVFGDPDQSIYAFRGAESTALRDVEVDRTVALTGSRRLPPAILAATRRVAAQLPGSDRSSRSAAAWPVPGPDGRASAGEGVPVGRPGGGRRRGPAAQGTPAGRRPGSRWRCCCGRRLPVWPSWPRLRGGRCPVLIGGGNEVLSAEPLVAALLTVLECGVDPAALTGQVALDLMASPIGGMDALALRRVRRALRAARPDEGTSADLLAAVLGGAPPPASVSAELLAPLRRVRGLLEIARAGAPAVRSPNRCSGNSGRRAGLEHTLVAAVERGGTGGQRADRALDAVLGLFAMAADLAERVPLAGVRAFVDEVRGHQLPGTQDARPSATRWQCCRRTPPRVWNGTWWPCWAYRKVPGPTCGRADRCSADGTAGSRGRNARPVTVRRGRLAEERRLFYVACTRARRTLVCTAVANQDQVPSRFLLELAGSTTICRSSRMRGAAGSAARRGLHLTDLVADLRRAVINPATSAADAAAAAQHLAALAAAGVPGARPAGLVRPGGVLDRCAADRPGATDPGVAFAHRVAEHLRAASRAGAPRGADRTGSGAARGDRRPRDGPRARRGCR